MKMTNPDKMLDKYEESFGTRDFSKISHKHFIEFVPRDLINDVSTSLFDRTFEQLSEEMEKVNKHINYLEFRKKLEEKLRVAINRDKAITQLLSYGNEENN